MRLAGASGGMRAAARVPGQDRRAIRQADGERYRDVRRSADVPGSGRRDRRFLLRQAGRAAAPSGHRRARRTAHSGAADQHAADADGRERRTELPRDRHPRVLPRRAGRYSGAELFGRSPDRGHGQHRHPRADPAPGRAERGGAGASDARRLAGAVPRRLSGRAGRGGAGERTVDWSAASARESASCRFAISRRPRRRNCWRR